MIPPIGGDPATEPAGTGATARGLPARRALPRLRRRPIGVFVVGLSPAVVTETLYALARRRPRVVPEEVHIITTQAGLSRAAESLLGRRGALARLREEYGLPRGTLRCRPENIHLLRDSHGDPLDDILSSRDSEVAGEQIAGIIRDLAQEDGVELHCSLAGGRKTMGALLATALQLYGRSGDRLYHVLVSAPFEQVPGFFFPSRVRTKLSWNGGTVDARVAEVALAEVPVVRLGPAVQQLGLTQLGVVQLARELEAEANGRLVPEALTIDVPERAVRIGRHEIRLSPQHLALYLIYARGRKACRRDSCQKGGRCARCQLTDDQVHERQPEILRLRDALRGHTSRARSERPNAGLATQSLLDFRAALQQARSRLNGTIAQAVGRGPRGLPFLVTETNVDGRRRRGLGASGRLIHLRHDKLAAVRTLA